MLSFEYLLFPIFLGLNNSNPRKIGFLFLLLFPTTIYAGCLCSTPKNEFWVADKVGKAKLEPICTESININKRKKRRFVMVLSVEMVQKLHNLKEPHPLDERRENN